MAIKHVIIHVVKRDKDGERLTKQLRDHENNTDGLTKQLTDGLLELFSNAHLNIGEFGVDGDNNATPVFEQKLRDFYDDDCNCSNFVDLTQALANRYEAIIVGDQLHSVKGGYLIFYQYERNHDDWLGVAVVKKTEGIDVSVDLDVVASEILELNKLHLGAAINLTQWKDALTSRYIRFKTGRATELREYFEKFIGCQRDKEAAKRETKQLKKAIQDFAKNTCGMNDDVASQKVTQAHDYVKERQKAGEPVKLSHVSNHVFPDRADEFAQQARQEYDLPEDLAIDSTELKRYKKLSGSGKGISISFDREKLNTVVKYDLERKQLTFNEIPNSLREAIEKELLEENNVED
ncbi:nucleoid-associated protein [Pseudoalteromonas rubra]|uniref:Nucleoid-associated protein n=1 Tax=Pseudoalteromonas rubra TaxID=43658 RepID=A0A8T0C992_9GAMM|nr:nucleoid-associated protein [Pseudoalteromonas rubra]KAF7787180.1 nucleoid-associated protein [Pseudoalteromonas rubra]